jgi:biopolymer transport protein ExbB
MNIFDHIVRFFQGGGLMMYPIATVLVVGICIAIERWIYLTHSALRNRGLWSEVAPLLAQGNFRQAVQMTPNPAPPSARSSTMVWPASAPRAAAMTSRRPWRSL